MKYKYLEPLAASHLTYYTNGNTSAGTFPKHLFWGFGCSFDSPLIKAAPTLSDTGEHRKSLLLETYPQPGAPYLPTLHPNTVLPSKTLSLSSTLEASFLRIPQLCQLQMPVWLFSLCWSSSICCLVLLPNAAEKGH